MYIKLNDFINEIKSANIEKGKDKPDRHNAERSNIAEILSSTEDEEVILNKITKIATKEKEPVRLHILASACNDLDRPDLALLFNNRLIQIEQQETNK